MAPDKKGSKRKGMQNVCHIFYFGRQDPNVVLAAPAASDSPAKKTKKVDAKPTKVAEDAAPKSILKKKENGAAKSKETKSESSAKADGAPARQAKPRKRAADFLSDEESEKPAPATTKKPVTKKTKKDEITSAPVAKKSASAKVGKPTPKAKKVEEVPEESDDEEFDIHASESEESEEEVDDVEDDQTAALIKGFESSGDEDESGDEGYDSKQPIPKIPDTKKAEKKVKKLQEGNSKDEPGTVYVG